MKKPNLMILGASGGVASAFLHCLVHNREFIDRLVLVSPKDRIYSNPYIDHKNLRYTFIKQKIDPYDAEEYHKLLKKHDIDIVLDLSDMDSIPILEATNRYGVSYINTSLNAEKKSVSELVFDIYPRKKELNRAVHILCAGMNPGIVNMMVRHGIEKFGIPKQIIHFEYDTSRLMMPSKLRHVAITWSPHEFLVENVRDPSGIAVGRNKVRKLVPNALNYRQDMKPILSPILKLQKYPKGFVVLHEENLTVSLKYNIPSRFIYSTDDEAMDDLVRIYKRKGKILRDDLTLVTNTKMPLEGSDSIGVLLDYNGKKVYYFNSVSNISMIGMNATYFQVIVGIFAALFTLLFDKLGKGVYFVEDLYATNYKYYAFDNMRIQEFVFKKKRNKLEFISHSPMVKLAKHGFRHIYI